MKKINFNFQSPLDLNGDGLITSGREVVRNQMILNSNYLYIQTNPDDSITLYLLDNDIAKSMIEGYT